MAKKRKGKFPLKRAIQQYESGFNYNQIARSLGYNSVTVSANLKKAGVVHGMKTEPLAVEGLVRIDVAEAVKNFSPEEHNQLEEEVFAPEPEPKPEPKSPTKPWLQTENPWVPDMTRLRSKHKGFVARWTNPELLEKREGEGMQIARAEDWGEKSKQGDGAYKRKGMILMEMPEEIAESKRAYLKHKTDLQDPAVLQKAMVEKGRQISLQAHVDMGLHKED